MDESRKAFEKYAADRLGLPLEMISDARNGDRYMHAFDSMSVMQPINGWWTLWQASREALNIELTPACWRTYYPDTDEHQYRAHSESGPESCARRIASEIGGYVVPVYYGKPQNCAAGIKVKE